MSRFKRFMPWMIWILLVSCISQTPSELKSISLPLKPYEAACSSVAFEGQILNKNNILNIFQCTGWSKIYPDLHRAIQSANEEAFNHSFETFNKNLFERKSNRRTFFKLLIELESKEHLDVLAKLIELSFQEHNIFTQLSKILETAQIGQESRTSLMKVFSHDDQENLKNLSTLKNILEKFEIYKPQISRIFEKEDNPRIQARLISMMDEIFSKSNDKDWGLISEVIVSKNVNLQDWFVNSSQGNVLPLLDVITEKDFLNDIQFLKNSLENGISCNNLANHQQFEISVSKELKHKIESLKFGTKEELSSHLLHGMTKYVAFQEFCQEKEQKQGLDSFVRILKHINSLLDSDQDYLLLKGLHQLFGEDRYKIIDFLSSKTFAEISKELIFLRERGEDEQFVHLIHKWLSELSYQELINLSKFSEELANPNSRTSKWYKAWTELWPYLTRDQKEQFINFVKIFFPENIEASKAIDSLINLFNEFPKLSSALAQDLDDDKFQIDLRYVMALLSEGSVQKDMSRFLSNKGLFELLRLLTRDAVLASQTDKNGQQIRIVPGIENTLIVKNLHEKKKTCFELIHSAYLKDSNYYALVNHLPVECKQTLGQAGFVGQIYLWMNSSNSFFELKGVEDYHAGTGVWSPPMLHFLFSSALLADQYLVSSNGKRGIRNNIDEIYRVLTMPNFLEKFHRFSKVAVLADSKINFSNKLNKYIHKNDNQKFGDLIKDVFTITRPISAQTYEPLRNYNCKDLENETGVNPCLSNEILKSKSLDVLRILKRKNENGSSLIKELLAWIHPASSVQKQTTIDETIRFLYDLSSENTKQTFVFRTENEKKTFEGTTVDRLEVLIRDIGFLNNYFGSYFKNEVAGAENYRKYLISSKKTMLLLDVSSPAFRAIKGLPKESQWKLKNVRSTYNSLIEISDQYKQPDGTQRTYSNFIQGLLQSIVRSSKLSTQDFNPYRYPKAEMVEGHNGIFLTRLVEMSALRHLSQMTRNYLSDDLKELNSKEFRQINQNLIPRFDLIKIQNSTQSLLDRYLDNNQNQINQMVSDIIDLQDSLNLKEKNLIRDLGFKFVLLMSNLEFEQTSVEKLGEVIEPIVKNWPKIYPLIKNTPNRTNILKSLNEILDMLNHHPKIANRLLKELLELELITASNLNTLFEDREFLQRVFDFISFELDFESDLNWRETFEAVLAGDSFKFHALKSWLKDGLSGEEKKLSLMLLISVLGEKNDDGYRLKSIFDELFLNHRSKLEQFLDETFTALSFKSDQKSLSH